MNDLTASLHGGVPQTFENTFANIPSNKPEEPQSKDHELLIEVHWMI